MQFDVKTEQQLAELVDFMGKGVDGINRESVIDIAIHQLHREFSKIEGFKTKKERPALAEQGRYAL